MTQTNQPPTNTGRFSCMLLLVMGDDIRENVSAITEYIADHAGLHFTFGLVKYPVFNLGDGRRIVQPRVMAKTTIVNRTAVELDDAD